MVGDRVLSEGEGSYDIEGKKTRPTHLIIRLDWNQRHQISLILIQGTMAQILEISPKGFPYYHT